METPEQFAWTLYEAMDFWDHSWRDPEVTVRLISARDAEVRADERACIAEHAEHVIDRVEAMWAEQEGRDDEEEGDVSEAVAMTTIKITEEIDSDGVSTGLQIEPEDAPLVTILGLLRLAEDTAIRMAMGEADDE